MEDKLTIEHLAPYLPFEVKLIEVDIAGYIYSKNIYKLTMYSIPDVLNTDRQFALKPILRPVSPEIFNDVTNDLIYLNDGRRIEDYYFKPLHIDFIQSVKIYNYLLKNHYDVFGLIEKGLAIDINTIEKK